jgi:predicted SnoaL-like aldol condensation-catalyzing enzyme
MKRCLCIAIILSAASFVWALDDNVAEGSKTSTLTETNRAIVSRFVDLFYRQKQVRAAFEAYVAKDYIQHNPEIADGREAAVLALEPMFSKPTFMTDVKRIIVDGDIAVVHLYARSAPEERGGSVMDMFRLKNGKIVEHWDVLQTIPEKSANPHPMF